jgi:Arc/MetJ-type ribon-helix-helix transcriptional regulator
MSDADKTLVPGDVTVESKGSKVTDSLRESFREVRPSLEDFKNSVKEFAQKLPDQIKGAIESIQARVNAITVQVDDETQQKVDSLVEAGIFKNRSESAAYLIHEGIKARGEVFEAIAEKLAEIERMRAHLRDMLGDDHHEG